MIGAEINNSIGAERSPLPRPEPIHSVRAGTMKLRREAEINKR